MITAHFKPKDGAKPKQKKKPAADASWTPEPLPAREDVEWTALEEHLEASWRRELGAEFAKPYWRALGSYLEAESRAKKVVYPPREQVWNAFRLTPFDRVRLVVIGQDPYHGAGQAEGLSFSVPRGQKVPSSLRNMFKELGDDVAGFRRPSHGSLVRWAEQGVLMLNTVLTVRHATANSHRKRGWEQFTAEVVRRLAARDEPVIFILWGKQAQANEKLLKGTRHKVLKSPHPSGLSAHRGFYGCRHFSKANDLLRALGHEPIDWNLPA